MALEAHHVPRKHRADLSVLAATPHDRPRAVSPEDRELDGGLGRLLFLLTGQRKPLLR